MLDRARLTKLLAMTTSENDGEALNAMRMANKLLTAEKASWEEVLAAQPNPHFTVTVTRRAEPAPYKAESDWVAPHLRDKVIIDIMFRTIYSQPRSNEEFFQWVDSVHNRWQQHGNVTQAQYAALQRSYQRVRR